ncbi:PKD domain-containing protein [Tenacibaculum ovolyticum]|uniref:PKD domain-containing protein n=1 Tax=Tenacibaculum ovolyticum TaxID=104270 RepID=UPI000412813F|nr:BACON domain-containing carbohydrate-binding protein [Tenacibaculum ovolyticum]
MKRVVFGYGGGFPLEQETLMQIQEAYSEDMLEALFALWGLEADKKYLIKSATENEEGWLIVPVKILVEGNEDSSIGKEAIKPQLVRLLYNAGGTRVSIEDAKAGAVGELQYATGAKNKVYEEFVGKLVVSGGEYNFSDFIPLKTIKQITNEVASNESQINNIKEDYLPRNGAKPMTGDLHLGVDKPTLTNGEDGTKLVFKGTANNTDNVFINKHTPSSDTTELRVSIGDNADQGGRDAFVIGGAVAGQEAWREKFRVQTDGKVGIGVTNPSKSLEVDAKGESLKFKNLKTLPSQTPLVIDEEGNVGKNTTGITSANFSTGMVMMWSGDPTTVPIGWILCDGRTGINGIRIPDLRGRFVLGYDSREVARPIENIFTGDNDVPKDVKNYGAIHNTGGLGNVTLIVDEMPSHNHDLTIGVHARSFDGASDIDRPYKTNAGEHLILKSSPTGGDKPHENRPPYYVLAFIIYVGDYNLVPVVSGGSSQTITLPTNSVTLSGSASDRDGTISSIKWSKVNGGAAVIVNKNALTTQVTGLAKGNYAFRLKVTDNEGAAVSHTVGVLVRAAVKFSVSGALRFKLNGTPQNGVPIHTDGEVKAFISSGYNWQLENKPDFITITPSSGSGTEVLTVTIQPNSFKRSGTISFLNENNERASLAWSQESTVIGPGGGGGGGGCFDLESDVLMANGRSKKLKNIIVGDELRIFDFAKNLPAGNEEFELLSELMKGATKEVSKVVDFGTKKVSEYRKITLLNGGILQITPSHPILASRDKEEVAWLLPDDLRGGYYIVDKDGSLVEIESKKTVKESLEIGILQLEKGDNYFIEGCMVHNAQIVRAEARIAGDIAARPIDEFVVLDKEGPIEH